MQDSSTVPEKKTRRRRKRPSRAKDILLYGFIVWVGGTIITLSAFATLGKGSINIANTTTTNITTTATFYESDMSELKDQVGEIAQKHGIPEPYMKAIAMQESNWTPEIMGPQTKSGRAVGLMQVMSATARAVCGLKGTDEEVTEELLKSMVNINCACLIFREEMERFKEKNNVGYAFAAYNAGAPNAEKAMESWPETRKYVYRVRFAVMAFDPNTKKCETIDCLRVKDGANDGGAHDERLDRLALAIQNDDQIGWLLLWVSGFNDEGPGKKKFHKEDGHRTGIAMDVVLTYRHEKELFIEEVKRIGNQLPGLELRIVDEVNSNNCIHIELKREA